MENSATTTTTSRASERWSSGLTIRAKLLLLSALVLVGFGASSLMAIMIISEVKVGSPLYRQIAAQKSALEEIALLKSDLNEIRAELFVLGGERDARRIYNSRERIMFLGQDADARFKTLVARAASDSQRAMFQEAQQAWQDFDNAIDAKVMPLVEAGQQAAAHELIVGIQAQRAQVFLDRLSKMVTTVQQEIQQAEAGATRLVTGRLTVASLVGAVLLILILFTGYVIANTVIKPLQAGVEFAEKVARGNLQETLVYRRADEIGTLAEALNGMVANLATLVGRIINSSGALNQVSRQLSSAAHQVVKAAELQAEGVSETSAAVIEINASVREVAGGVDNLAVLATESSSSILELVASVEEVAANVGKLNGAVEEVSTSVAEMAASIRQIGDSAQLLEDSSSTMASSVAQMDASIRHVEQSATTAATISGEVLQDAEYGNGRVAAMVEGIDEIRASSAITAEVVATLSARAEDIGSIVSVIDEVAEQTNLLALNAAIIAAQAGEHGKGFAVVADEIKELAERTQSSTREIAAVIAAVQDETQRAVTAIQQAEARIDEGVQLSRQSGEALNKIVSGVQRSTVQVREIARATVEQARGSQMIREAVEQVSGMIGQIALATREQARGSELIASAAERMRTLTGQVKVSTSEQSKTGALIARATEQVSTMVSQIKRACGEQLQSSTQIVRAVENIQSSNRISLEATRVMDDAVEQLSSQVTGLRTDVASFRIDDGTAPLPVGEGVTAAEVAT